MEQTGARGGVQQAANTAPAAQADTAALSIEDIKQAVSMPGASTPVIDGSTAASDPSPTVPAMAPQTPPASPPAAASGLSPIRAAPPSGPAASPPPHSAVAWARDHQNAAIAVAFVLVLLYVAPILVITKAAIDTQGFQEPNAWFRWFAAFMKTSDSTLGSVHKVLFPFIATLSIVAFKDRINYGVIGLGVFVLLMFMLSVGVGVLFDMSDMAVALRALPDKIEPEVARAFFSKVQDTLLMYMMLLLGVSVISDPAENKA